MLRRALTLLELLFALALVLALGAIIAPALTRTLAERRFEAACDQTRELLTLARAHAQAMGDAVEVIYLPAERAIRARTFDPANRAAEGDDDPGAFAPVIGAEMIAPGSGLWARDERADERESLGPWAQRELPRLCAITDRDPQPREAGFESWVDPPEPESPVEPGAETGDGARPLRLAVFLPDGSTLTAQPRWITGERSRAASITINRWTGLALIEEITVPDEGGESERARRGKEREPVHRDAPQPRDAVSADEDDAVASQPLDDEPRDQDEGEEEEDDEEATEGEEDEDEQDEEGST